LGESIILQNVLDVKVFPRFVAKKEQPDERIALYKSAGCHVQDVI